MINLGGKKVAKIILGGEILWERQDPDTTWIQLPDDGISGKDFVGPEFMRFNPKTRTADFSGMRMIGLISGSAASSHLILKLPEGYTFSKDNSSVISLLNTGGKIESFTPKYVGSEMYATFGSAYAGNSGTQYLILNAPVDGSTPYQVYDVSVIKRFSMVRTFNVIKED